MTTITPTAPASTPAPALPDEYLRADMRLYDPPSALPRLFGARRFPYDLVIFDLDGTLVTPKSGKVFRERPDDWRFIGATDEDPLGPRARFARLLRSYGVKLAIATNQGGVAAYPQRLPAQQMVEQIQLAGKLIGTSATLWCFAHPSDRSNHWRKPAPGMLDSLLMMFRIGADRTLMVGDRLEDKHAAQAAKQGEGVDFAWAWDFFGDPLPADLDMMVAKHVTRGLCRRRGRNPHSPNASASEQP